MTTKERATRWFMGIWNDRDPGVIHELMDPQCRGHTEGGIVIGPVAFEELMYRPFIAAFPDMRLTLHQVIADGDDAASVKLCV